MTKLDNILYVVIDSEDAAKAKSALKSLVLELIGEYETKGRQPEGTAEDWKARGRDELRRQLRRQIEAL